jgi:site-specific DNA recombinase
MIPQNIPLNQGTNKAVIYIRVSSEEQVENFSLSTQEELCRRDAKYKGYEIDQVFREEGKSAKTITGRPELLKLLDYCKKNKKDINAVYVYRLDRLSRQTSDYLAIRKKLFDYNIAIISASEPTGNSPTEKLLETVLASFAQHDNDVRSERTKNGMRARFLSGLITNHVPLGYINQAGYALKDPQSFSKVKKAWDIMATGTKSLREVANILNDQNITYKGKVHKVRINTMQRIFRNKFYMGILRSDKYPEEVRGQHIPLVTEEQFYKVQAILDGRNVSTPIMPRKSRDNKDFPLRRILRCSKCGTPFTGAWSRGRSTRYGYYFCRSRCVTSSTPIGDVDTDVKKFLKKTSPTESGLNLYIAILIKTFNVKMSKLNKIKNVAEDELQKLYALRQTLVEKNLAGLYSDEIFKEQNAVIENKIIAAQSAKNGALIEQYNLDAIIAFIKAKLSDLAQTYSTSTLSQLRCLIGSIFLTGIEWNYPGISNQKISPIYQSILETSEGGVPFGDPSGIRIHDLQDENLTS